MATIPYVVAHRAAYRLIEGSRYHFKAIANLAEPDWSHIMGHHFDSDLTGGRAFDRAWLRAHAITHCRIQMPWSWRLEKAFPTALMVFGFIAVTATLLYSLCGR